MADPDFDLKALYEALDEQRSSRDMTWAAVTQEVNRFRTERRPIALSTITGIKDKTQGKGDGILQMVLWKVSTAPGNPAPRA